MIPPIADLFSLPSYLFPSYKDECTPASHPHRRVPGLILLALLLLNSGCGPNRTTSPPIVPAAVATAEIAPPTAATPPKFVDITSQAGIRFTAVNGKTPRKYLVETMG